MTNVPAVRWLEAIREAERTKSFDPLIRFLDSGATLGLLECSYLKDLLVRLQYKRKRRGRVVPIGHLSAKYRNEKGRARVRQLMREEKLTREAAIDRVVKQWPELFGADNGLRLANFIKSGKRGK